MLSDALELVANQALLPIMASVTASQLTDLLKERRWRRLSRQEAEKAAAQFG